MTHSNSREFFVLPEREIVRYSRTKDKMSKKISDDLNPDLFDSVTDEDDAKDETSIPILSTVPSAEDISDKISEDNKGKGSKPKYSRDIIVKQFNIDSAFTSGRLLLYRGNSNAFELYGGCGQNYKLPVFNTNVQENLFSSEESLDSAVLSSEPSLDTQKIPTVIQVPIIDSSSNGSTVSSGLEPLLELYSHKVLGDVSFSLSIGRLTINGEHPIYRPMHAKAIKQVSEILKQLINDTPGCNCEHVNLVVKRLDSNNRKFWSKLGYDNAIIKNLVYASS